MQEHPEATTRLGIAGVVVPLLDNPVGSFAEWRDRRDVWAKAIDRLSATAVASSARVVIDPFSIALKPSGQWGIFLPADAQGSLTPDNEATTYLIEDLGRLIVECGATGIITLGRVPREVEIARRIIGDRAEIYSFSTNSETSAAYAGNPAHAVTNQKVMPGQTDEMLMWAIADIQCGTDVSVTKPIENFHVSAELIRRVSNHADLKRVLSMLSGAPDTPTSRQLAAYLEVVSSDVESFLQRARSVRYGAYTVSGTTRLLGLLARTDGVSLARGRYEEMWRNAIAAARGHRIVVIDRGASAYFRGSVLA